MRSLLSKLSRVGRSPARPIQSPCGLMSLPNELLFEIANYLTTTRNVSALLRANKRLAILLSDVLSAMLLRIDRFTIFRVPREGAEPLVRYLISLSIDLDTYWCHCTIPRPDDCMCNSPLHSAITRGNTALVSALLCHGTSITRRFGTAGDTAVHHAIKFAGEFSYYSEAGENGGLPILNLILSKVCLRRMNDPASLNAAGQTWLSTAVRVCPRRTVKLVMPFLVRGLDVNVADAEMNTPLHFAMIGKRPDLAKMLLQRGAKYRTENMLGQSPWGIACISGSCGLIEVLLNRDAGLINTPLNAAGETFEVHLQRSISRFCGSYRRPWDGVYGLERLYEKVNKLVRASRSVVGVRCVLQVYYFVL